MATSSGPTTMMSSTQMRIQSMKFMLKKRQASVLHRANPCLVRKYAKCFCRDAGADRRSCIAFLSFHA
eukprot:8092909-Alexandrium_andersonii.AAC.1